MFAREIEECVEIAAGPAEVWYQLTNFAAYPEWNPFIKSIEGELREGARLTVTMKLGSMPTTAFRPRLVVVERERELRWVGRLGVPGVFDGEHAFVIESLGIDKVRLTQSERFGGMLVPGALALTEGEVREAFRDMNERLRQRAEAAHATRQVALAQKQERDSGATPSP